MNSTVPNTTDILRHPRGTRLERILRALPITGPALRNAYLRGYTTGETAGRELGKLNAHIDALEEVRTMTPARAALAIRAIEQIAETNPDDDIPAAGRRRHLSLVGSDAS